jgi:hypothetical protein
MIPFSLSARHTPLCMAILNAMGTLKSSMKGERVNKKDVYKMNGIKCIVQSHYFITHQ